MKLEFTELDINYLDVNFLEDLLDIIEDVNEVRLRLKHLKTDIDLKGTEVGYDANTQINTFMTDNVITFKNFRRYHTFRLRQTECLYCYLNSKR